MILHERFIRWCQWFNSTLHVLCHIWFVERNTVHHVTFLVFYSVGFYTAVDNILRWLAYTHIYKVMIKFSGIFVDWHSHNFVHIKNLLQLILFVFTKRNPQQKQKQKPVIRESFSWLATTKQEYRITHLNYRSVESIVPIKIIHTNRWWCDYYDDKDFESVIKTRILSHSLIYVNSKAKKNQPTINDG